MTQDTDGISLAHAAALKLMGLARQLSLAAAVFLIAAIVAGTAGTSYAKNTLLDTVVVSNYGALFGGSVETFVAGSIAKSAPFKDVIGTNTLLSDANGPADDAQSSLTGEIAVTVPLYILEFVPIPNGWVQFFSAGATGNSQPDAVIGSLTPYGYPNNTGLSMPVGVAYRDPWFYHMEDTGSVPSDELTGISSHPMHDEIAVSNPYVAVVYPNDETGFLCGNNPPTTGYSLGTITEYHTDALTPFSPDFNGVNNILPHHNSPVNYGTQNATIGGCDTDLLGPVGLVFNVYGQLLVVNQLGGYVTVYDTWASGDAAPVAIFGSGDLIEPAYIAVDSADNAYVTDVGDNSIKIFAPPNGTYVGEIAGKKTHLNYPEGIAISRGDNLYVVNNDGNSLSEWEAVDPSGGGNIAPTLTVTGKGTNLNLPVGVALPQFSAAVSSTATAKRAFAK